MGCAGKMSARRGRPPIRRQGQGRVVPAPETSGEPNGDWRQEMAEVRGTLAGMMRTIERLAANQARQEPTGQETGGNPIGNNEEQTPVSEAQRNRGNDNANGQLLKNFMANHPPEFCGDVDAITAENWMMAMEKHLRAIGCMDMQKVRLATFLLRGDAERWWETTRQRFGNREPLWLEFQTAFNERFFPDWVREQKTYEFIELEQGDSTVAQYEAEFTSLARFAPGLVSSEDMKAAKFQRGLRAEIRYALAGARIPDFATIVQRAYAIEKDQNEFKTSQTSRKRIELSQGPSGNKKRKGEMRTDGNVVGPPACSICGKRHGGTCRLGSIECYLCGQVGHRQRDCPQQRGAMNLGKDVGITCFQCGQKGHRASSCPQAPQPWYGGQGPRFDQRPLPPGAARQQMAPSAPQQVAYDKPRGRGRAFALTAIDGENGNEKEIM